MEDTLKEKIKHLLHDEGVDIMHHNSDVIDFGIAAYNLALSERWVDVRDRLPDSDLSVITFCDGSVNEGYYDADDKEWRLYGIGSVTNVTHWQPLPTPPQTKD